MIAPILAVKDVDASVEFYTQKLGFDHDFSMQGPDGKNTFAFVNMGQRKINIGLSLDPPLEYRGRGVVLMLYVPDETDLDQYYADVQKRGVAIAEPIKDEYWGDRVFTVHDPDGFVLSFCKTVKQVPAEEIAAAMRGDGKAD